MKILLTTEGTYPYYQGGVSTWAHELVNGLPEHEFVVAAVIGGPDVTRAFNVPENTSIVPIPLWGTEKVDEYVQPDPKTRRRNSLRGKSREKALVELLLPAYEELIGHLLETREPRALGAAIADIARYCETNDLHEGLRDPRCWQLVRARLSEHPLLTDISMADAIDFARSLYRYLTPLAVPLPDVDVAHTSGAALCALPALAAKLNRGVPLLLTEHGVYVRERVLHLVRNDTPLLRKVLLGNLYRAIARCAYTHADVVLPVCAYNTNWEYELGADPASLQVVHNGVNPDEFVPREVELDRPTIAYVGRIEPLKDILGLINALHLVRREIPDVLLRIYGPEDDRRYAQRCRLAVATLQLEDNVVFEGATNDPVLAYQESDVVVLCSVSEGFPYTVVEAMCTGRPVVATAVGGVPEALNRPELLVEPQNPQALADALVALFRQTPAQRAAIGAEFRERAVELFSQERFLEAYRSLYLEVAHDYVA
ncbi:glycosyltransferase involved in cell wall biosynthesis [Arthrobacter sp. V1I9]|uniref:GT4 family glycosyltransferase PelF n=1 Tax=Arthrobacter sp. V1I9 TaxID=3042275 RepID=UPI00278CEDBD|nr:GT4 family glycosyltransferase PelF [Arthrobacter sp. V1I9]MDQ0868415.1 glycosyltransferase involved in cell wall biosynthesis [Arthrobacter sp. V1I9]